MTRTILAALSIALILCSCSVTDDRMPVAIVMPITHPSLEQIEKGFVKTIEEQAPGKYRFKTFNAQGNKTLMRSEIEEIAQGEYRLVFTIGNASSQMTAEVFRKKSLLVPLVFTVVNDPMELGIIDSEEYPGGRITGVKEAVRYRDEIEAFLSYVNDISKVLIVYNPLEVGLKKDASEAADIFKQCGVDVEKIEVFKGNELKSKVASQLNGVQAIMVLKDNTVVAALDVLAKLCIENRVALLASDLDSPDKGAAMGYGVHEREYGVEAAKKALMILEESRQPGSIGVTSVNEFTMKINREAAEKQGVKFRELKPL